MYQNDLMNNSKFCEKCSKISVKLFHLILIESKRIALKVTIRIHKVIQNHSPTKLQFIYLDHTNYRKSLLELFETEFMSMC